MACLGQDAYYRPRAQGKGDAWASSPARWASQSPLPILNLLSSKSGPHVHGGSSERGPEEATGQNVQGWGGDAGAAADLSPHLAALRVENRGEEALRTGY